MWQGCRFIVAAAALLVGTVALAQQYPARAVRVIVPYSTGGGTDILMRQIGVPLALSTGQQFIVDNRPGANGITGTEMVTKAAPDGYTLVMSTNALTINPALYSKIPFDTARDLAPVTIVSFTQNMLAVHPSLPVKTVRELVGLAKIRPGQLAFGSGGSGQPSHMSGELFKQMAGVDLLHVPYKGSGASLTDLVAGQISVSFSSMPSLMPYVKAGRLRPLAVCGTKRSPAAPEVPTVSETLPGYDVELWFGILAPAATPREIIGKLHAEIARALALPDMKERLAGSGYEPGGNTPEDYAAKIRAELPRWAGVVKAARIRVE